MLKPILGNVLVPVPSSQSVGFFGACSMRTCTVSLLLLSSNRIASMLIIIMKKICTTTSFSDRPWNFVSGQRISHGPWSYVDRSRSWKWILFTTSHRGTRSVSKLWEIASSIYIRTLECIVTLVNYSNTFRTEWLRPSARKWLEESLVPLFPRA